MEQKNINPSSMLLSPLYDFNFEFNSNLSLIGFYNYCPELPYTNKLIVLYEVINKKGADNILFPFLFKKEFILNDSYLIVLLNIPKKYTYDYELLIEGDFDNISMDCKYKILNASNNASIKYFLQEILSNSVNLSLKQNSINCFKFGIKDMLKLTELQNKSRSDNATAFLFIFINFPGNEVFI